MICPIKKDTALVICSSKELVKSMRRLHRDLLNCQYCEEGEECALRSNFAAMIDTAIDEVNREWNNPIPAAR